MLLVQSHTTYVLTSHLLSSVPIHSTPALPVRTVAAAVTVSPVGGGRRGMKEGNEGEREHIIVSSLLPMLLESRPTRAIPGTSA